MRKLIVVTGGSKGIGRAILEKFSQAGFDVATCSRNEPELRLNPTAGVGGLLHQALDNGQLFDGIHKALEGLLKPKP